MSHDPLDDLLRDYARGPVPATSQILYSEVRSAIETRRGNSHWKRLFPILNWHEVMAERRFVAFALVVALLVGVVPAAIAHKAKSAELARASLHFDVFSSSISMIDEFPTQAGPQPQLSRAP